MRLTKNYVIANTSISNVYSTAGSTLRGCNFQMSFDLLCRTDDRLYTNMLKWGWKEDKGMYVITCEGLRNLRRV